MNKKKVGRPLKYSSVEEMETKIEEYFNDCDDREAVYTIEGLAYWLDIDRHSINNYAERDEFFTTIKRAKAKVLARLQELSAKGKYNPTMAIFNLKNNYGYVDKQEITQETTHKGGTENKWTIEFIEAKDEQSPDTK